MMPRLASLSCSAIVAFAAVLAVTACPSESNPEVLGGGQTQQCQRLFDKCP
jgi:hypothetical protein